MRPEDAVAKHVRRWAGEDPKAPEMRPFRTEEHAGIVFEPKEHLHDVEIVLVPGWTSLGDGMAKLGYVLSRMGFRVHLLHLPGQGGPGGPGSVYDYIRRYVERLGRPVFLVGHSMGGEIVKFVRAKNVSGILSLAPAGPRRGLKAFERLDHLGRIFGPIILLANALRLRVSPKHISLSAPVEYMEVVRRFGGYGKGALLLGSKDGLVPHTDELYHYEHGIPKENVIHIEVFRGGHGFFADEKNIRAVAERIAQIALGFMGRR